MTYCYAPNPAFLGGIGEMMNPADALFISTPIALGPTSLVNDPRAGYALVRKTGLDGYRDALDVFAAASFLFPD